MNFKCRADAVKINKDRTITVYDYKTTSSIIPSEKHSNKLVYENMSLQVALYKEIIEKSTGLPVTEFYHIIQSTTEPYLIDTVKLNHTVFEEGKSQVNTALQKYKEALSIKNKSRSKQYLTKNITMRALQGYD